MKEYGNKITTIPVSSSFIIELSQEKVITNSVTVQYISTMSNPNTNPAVVESESPTDTIADNAMDVMEESPEEEDKEDSPPQKINRNELPGLVSDRVNPCVTKAVDYTLLVGLLILV